MIPQIKCLIKAANSLNLPYECYDKEHNFISTDLGEKKLTFQKNRTPFNSEVEASICLDKEYTYQLLKNYIKMPPTIGYLDPKCFQSFPEYTIFRDISLILSDIENHFNYPFVLKKNRGALSKNVFLCHNSEEAESSLKTIFDQASNHYDYVALAQTFIPTQKEYRVVFFNQKPILAYERFGGDQLFNASYWEHEQGSAILIKDSRLLQKFKEFAEPIFDKLNLGFVGLDIIVDINGDWHLIELNSSPKFTHFIQHNGENQVVEMYRTILLHCLEKMNNKVPDVS